MGHKKTGPTSFVGPVHIVPGNPEDHGMVNSSRGVKPVLLLRAII